MEVNEELRKAVPEADGEAAALLRTRSELRQSRRFVWHQRRRRAATGLNVSVAVGLAIGLTAMLNYGAHRYLPQRWSISSLDHYTLSERTLRLLREVRADVHLVPVYSEDNPLGDEVQRLLAEYAYAASRIEGLNLTVEPLDPDRDLVRVREMAERYDVREPDVVVVILGERHQVITEKDLVDYDRMIDGGISGGQLRMEKKKRGFRGEQAVSSAIHSLALVQRPIVYFLNGHGERDLTDFSNPPGYGSLARLLRRDNIEARPLMLAESAGVPTDADAVVVAGPTRQLAQAEGALLDAYLERSGRVLALLDPGQTSGLEGLLESWGVRLARDQVVGLTITGRELLIREYGGHPVTKPLMGMVTMFYGARSVEPIAAPAASTVLPADQPRVSALAMSADGWAEMNPAQIPPRFDQDADRPGPIAVAVAVERGAVRSIEMELRPTRMLVVGDSDFVSNAALRDGVGANADFLLNALNWLVDRDAMLEISPKAPIDLKLDMDRQQAKAALLIMVAGIPLLAAVAGLVVWLVRRR